jgi:molybdopterin-binding protein
MRPTVFFRTFIAIHLPFSRHLSPISVHCASWQRAFARLKAAAIFAPCALFRKQAVTDFIHRGSEMSIQAINARNQFKGKIKEIVNGPVVSEIVVETPHGIVTSVITTRSVKDLALVVGTEVLALVKATEVSIAKI